MRRTAAISACRKYRYALTRVWDDELPRALFVMLNPSTADALKDDPTIRKCIGFAKRWGLGGLAVVNLYAYRTTDPAALWRAAEDGMFITGGSDAALWIGAFLQNPQYRDNVVAAWGANVGTATAKQHGGNFWAHTMSIILRDDRAAPTPGLVTPVNVQCLGHTAGGHPRHPVRLAYATRRRPL